MNMESVLGSLLSDGEVVAGPVAAGIVATDADDRSGWRGSLYLSGAQFAKPGQTYTFRANDGRSGQIIVSVPVLTRTGSTRIGFTGAGQWKLSPRLGVSRTGRGCSPRSAFEPAC
jgi:hypothetical protein